MPRCSAADCKQMGSHTFPKDPNLRRLWERATNKENFKASKHSRLCSGHFKESDYVQVCVTTGLAPFHKYLKKTAIPSIFAWNNEHRLVSKEEVRTSSGLTCSECGRTFIAKIGYVSHLRAHHRSSH